MRDKSEVGKMDNWISVKDKLPEIDERVFVFYLALGFMYQSAGALKEGGRWQLDGIDADWMRKLQVIITHWRPQFEIPEEFQR